MNDPLFYPREFQLIALYKTIMEMFFEDDPHFYERSPVSVGGDDIVLDCGAAEGLFTLSIQNR
jgi:hypothetical protein